MLNKDFLNILEAIRKRKPAPVYLLQGEEVYFIDQISSEIEVHFLSEQEKGFNQVILYGGETTIPAILSNARRFPMMSDFQVVIVKEAQELPDLYKDTQSKLLLDYFLKPLNSTVLVLCHKYKSLDKRKDFGKKAEKAGVVHTFSKLKDLQLTEFARQYFISKGFSIDDGGAQVLADYIGNDLTRLTNEADKVMINREPGFAFNSKDIMVQVGISREYNIFELQKAIITKNSFKVFSIVRNFQSNLKRNPVIPCVAFLYSFFSKLLIASSLSNQHPSALTSALKISPYAISEYEFALKKYSPEQIRTIIGLLKEADLKLKGFGSSGEDDGQILQELVFRIMA